MSGAEALVALGLTSNVVQFIDFGSKLGSRINEYASSAVGAPKKIAALAVRLDLVLKTLDALNDTGRTSIEHEAKTVQSCISEAQEFDALLNMFKLKTRPAVDGEDRPSWIDKRLTSAEKTWKAFKSLRGEEKIEEFQTSLDRLLSLVSLQLQSRTASTSTRLEDSTGIIMQKSEQTLNTLHDLQMWMRSLNLDKQVPSGKSEPITLIPYSRNLQFVRRGNIFDELDDKVFRNPNHNAALCGLGGVGKSQIALEYAYKVKQRSPEYSIFWVYASNAARFEEAYKRISDECEIPGREDPKDDLMQLVRNWLETKIKMPWLMIVDNVDNAREFFQKTHTGKSLLEYVPKSSNGYVLYTTRSRDIGWDLTGDPISVLSMTREEAGTLLDTKTGRQNTEEEKAELLNELDYLPLAIAQAAAFMAKRRKTVSQYLKLYRHSDSAKIRLLSHEFAGHGTETRRMESVATTWIISFEYIRSENQRAAEILSLMSFLDRQGIPESLIYNQNEDPVVFTDAIGILEAFSLVVVNEQGDSYNMHRLVQAATRTWLTRYDSGGETRWASQALSLLSKGFPVSKYSTLKLCTAYLPHAEAILDFVFEDKAKKDLLNRATLLLSTATYFKDTIIYEAARKRAEESFQIRENFLGPENPDTLMSLSILARVLDSLGKYQAAEEMNRRVLKGRERTLAPEHPDTLTSVSNLALALYRQGKYKAAEDIAQRALKGWERTLGPEHPETLITISNIALILSEQGKYKAAEDMGQRALKGREKMLGPEHPDTLTSLSILARVLGRQGKYKAAEEMNQRALEGRERTLGPEHPETLTAIRSLALVLSEQGKYKAAEEMNQRALEGNVKVLGPEHPNTLTNVTNLALVLSSQGKHKAAEDMAQRALEVRERTLGPEHPNTLGSLYCLAYILRGQGQYDNSSAIYLRACAGYERVLGSHHPTTLACSKHYASMLEEMERAKRDNSG